MSTVTITSSDTVERFRCALMRRSKKKGSDEACAVIAEELLEEVRQMPETERSSALWTIAAGNKAMELLGDIFWWKDPTQHDREPPSFPKTWGVLYEAILDGWESAFGSIDGTKATQYSFTRFIAKAIIEWDSKERSVALTKLREELKNVNPPTGWAMTCHFLAISEPGDDEDVIQTIGRAFGHFAGQKNLVLAASAILKADPHLKNEPPSR